MLSRKTVLSIVCVVKLITASTIPPFPNAPDVLILTGSPVSTRVIKPIVITKTFKSITKKVNEMSLTLMPTLVVQGRSTEGPENQTDNPCSQKRKLPNEDKPNWLLLYTASFNTVLVIMSLLLNLFIVTYYWSNSGNLSSILYLRNGIADSISAIGFLIQVPLVIRVLEEDLPSSLPLISYWITTVSVRMSVFMNCVLGVVRGINILSPFYLVNRKCVTISTLIYLLLWSTITSLDIWIYTSKIGLQNKIYLTKSLVLKTEPGFSLTSLIIPEESEALTSLSQGEIAAIQFLTPTALPAVLCFVLMLFQIRHLTKHDKAISDQPGSGAEKDGTSQGKTSSEGKTEKKKGNHNHRAAVTILIVTTVYVLTSFLSIAMFLVVYRTHLTLGREEKIKKLSWTEVSLIYISNSTSHLLCSTVIALTLILRSAKMQLHLKQTCSEKIRSLSYRVE